MTMTIKQFVLDSRRVFLFLRMEVPTVPANEKPEIKEIIIWRLVGWAIRKGADGDEVVGMVAPDSPFAQGAFEQTSTPIQRLVTVPPGPGLYVYYSDLRATLSRLMKVDISDKDAWDYLEKGIVQIHPPQAHPDAK